MVAIINKPTVLVLGAGASAPFGFPCGSSLITEILQHGQFLRNYFPHARNFISCLQDNGVLSIDEFLQCRQEYKDIGKLAIARVILRHESPDRLFKDRGSWYHSLLNIIGSDPKSWSRHQLSIITFNYDRSLEHFIIKSLMNLHNLADSQAWEYLKQIPIHHIHGKLGALPCEAKFRDVEYGKGQDKEHYAAQELKIIHDDIEYGDDLAKARSRLQWAKKIVFLGLGFHSLNLGRIGYYELDQQRVQREVYATGYNLRFQEKAAFIRDTSKVGKLNLGTSDEDVNTYFHNNLYFD